MTTRIARNDRLRPPECSTRTLTRTSDHSADNRYARSVFTSSGFSPQTKQIGQLTAATSYLSIALGMFYTPENRSALGRGQRWHCTACNDELINERGSVEHGGSTWLRAPHLYLLGMPYHRTVEWSLRDMGVRKTQGLQICLAVRWYGCGG